MPDATFWLQCLLFLPLFLVINLVILIVSLVFLFTRPMRQAVWDLAAKTVVVDR